VDQQTKLGSVIKMKKLLKKLELYESIDLELQMRPEHVFGCLGTVSASQSITITDLLSLNTNALDYQWTYREVSERNKLHVHVDIYPKHYIIFLQKLRSVTFVVSIFGLGIAVLGFSKQEYTMAFGALTVYVFLLFLGPIRLLKKMQWRLWDLRLDIEKGLKNAESELKNTDNKTL
jgi:hypothetical protein